MRPTLAAFTVVLALFALSLSQAHADKRCRGGKQFYAGQCRYPEEIRQLKAQAARQQAAAEERRKQEEARRAEEARQQRDRAACDVARGADNLGAWRSYLLEHPQGDCQAEAEERIAALEQEAAQSSAPPPPDPGAGRATGSGHGEGDGRGGGADGEDQEPSGYSALVPVGFAIGAVGLTTWGIAGAISLANRSTLSDECPDDVCSPDQQDTINTGEIAGDVATVGLVVGGAGVVLGVIGLLLPTADEAADEGSAAAHVRVFGGPGELGLMGHF